MYSVSVFCSQDNEGGSPGKFSDDDDDDDDNNRGEDNDNFGGDYDNDNDFGSGTYSPGAVSTCAYIHTHDNN